MAIVVLEHGRSVGALRLGAVLRDHSHRLRVVSLHDGDQVPADLDEVDGVITMGGRQSPLDDHEWIEPELEYLWRANAAGLPVIGICLGCQLLARALGGKLSQMNGGVELGWHEVSLTPVGAEDPLHAGIAWTSLQLHWHGYQVAKVPDGARVLARSQRCSVQAWALGLRTYGFQYHPEVYPETIETWVTEEPRDLDEAGLKPDLLRSQSKEFYRPFARLRDRLFTSMALLLMPADRRNQGLIKDLHH
ncbi:MAG: type 1 glutamine amidotransferase [Planctomycetota bacterium]|jgi:GMP synthase-like glutamine amidotransferase